MNETTTVLFFNFVLENTHKFVTGFQPQSILGTPHPTALCYFCRTKGVCFKLVLGIQNNSEVFGEMFEGGFADMCADIFLLKSMGKRSTPSSVRRREASPQAA